MRGVLVEKWTEFDKLQLAECPNPMLQPGQMRIKTQAAGVSFATSLIVAGKYQRKPPLPFVPGTEVSGVVTEVADAVPGWRQSRQCDRLGWIGGGNRSVRGEYI
jgi:NADPH2:quinone reductase